MILYIVTMYRWGCKERHSYVLGVFDKLSFAQEMADKEQTNHDNKYLAEVIEMPLNSIREDPAVYFNIMYSPEIQCKKCGEPCEFKELLAK